MIIKSKALELSLSFFLISLILFVCRLSSVYFSHHFRLWRLSLNHSLTLVSSSFLSWFSLRCSLPTRNHVPKRSRCTRPCPRIFWPVRARGLWCGNSSSVSTICLYAIVFMCYVLLIIIIQHSSSGVVMSGMGVDIRVPSEWVVESKVVEGKKCIGTHSGSCEWYGTAVHQTNEFQERVKYDIETVKFCLGCFLCAMIW